MRRVFAAFIACILLFACCASAVTLPSAPKDYTLDNANVISQLTEDVIYNNNQNLVKACGAQIDIVTLRSTGDYGSADYAYMLMNDWGVGDRQKDNGFMFLLALRGGGDDGYALITGSGAERILSAADCDQMLTDHFDQYYALGDYDSGVLDLFEAVFKTVANYYGLNLAYLDASAVQAMTGKDYAPVGRHDEGGNGLSTIIGIIIVILILSAVFGRRRRVRRAPGYVAPAPRPRYFAPRPPRPPRPMGGGFGGPRPSGGFGASRPSGGFGGSRPSSSGSRSSFSGNRGGSSRGSGASRGR